MARTCTPGEPWQSQPAKSLGPLPLTSYQGPADLLSCESRRGIKPSDGAHPTEKLGKSSLLSLVKCRLLCWANARQSPRKAELPAEGKQGRQVSRLTPPARPGHLVFCGSRWPYGYLGWGHSIQELKGLLTVAPLSFPGAPTPS